jgi:hypothetical protein
MHQPAATALHPNLLYNCLGGVDATSGTGERHIQCVQPAPHPQLSSEHVSSSCQQWSRLLQLPSSKPGQDSSTACKQLAVKQHRLEMCV